MPGTTLRVVQRKLYDFSKIQGSQGQLVYLARKIDVSQYREATFYARVHPGSDIAGLSVVEFIVWADGFTIEDPAAAVGSSPAFLASFQPNTDLVGVQAGNMAIIPVVPTAGGGIGAMLAIGLWVSQPASPATGRLWLSVDLSLKD